MESPEYKRANEDESEDVTAKARAAFEARDVDLTRKVHENPNRSPETHGGGGSEYLKSIVYGGLDGITSIFAIVASSAGASFHTDLILLLGLSKIFADAVSMGFGDFLSEKAKNDYIKSEQDREQWELENYEEGEKAEMVELYQKQGFTKEHAERVVDIFTQYGLLLPNMMVEELGLMPMAEASEPWKNGVTSFLAFSILGSVPLWFYFFFWLAHWKDYNAMFAIDCVATAVAMFGLGVFKAYFTHQNKLASGLWILTNGVIASAIAYFIGWGLQVALNVSSNGS
jgi:VIT1/CCC1 family predicted Fe2+/Mn2+ transporter